MAAITIADKAVKGLWNHALGQASLQKTAKARKDSRRQKK